MDETPFNLIFLLIPLALLIGRTIVRAKNRHAPPPPPPPRVPVEVEEDNEDLPHWLRGLKQQLEQQQEMGDDEFIEEEDDLPHWERAAKVTPKNETAAPAISRDEYFKEPAASDRFLHKIPALASTITPVQSTVSREPLGERPAVFPAAPITPAPAGLTAQRQAAPVQKGFPKLTHLSPLQQAVVMAEVLGPPKSTKSTASP